LIVAVLEDALLGGVERIDDRRLVVARRVLDRGDVEARPARVLAGRVGRRLAPLAGEHSVDRRDVALPPRRPAGRGLAGGALASIDHVEDRAARRVAFEDAAEEAGRERIVAYDAAALVDRRDGERRIVEEADEAHLGGTLRIGAVVGRTVEHEGAR